MSTRARALSPLKHNIKLTRAVALMLDTKGVPAMLSLAICCVLALALAVSDALPRHLFRRRAGCHALLVGQRIDLGQPIANAVSDAVQRLLLRPAQHLASNQIDCPAAVDDKVRRVEDI